MSEPKSQTKPDRGEFERYSKEALVRFIENLLPACTWFYSRDQAHRHLEILNDQALADAAARRCDAIEKEIDYIRAQQVKRLSPRSRRTRNQRLLRLATEYCRAVDRIERTSKKYEISSTATAKEGD